VIFPQEAGKTAEMIVVAMAQYEGVEPGGIDAEEIGVVD
jgi:hypothetical protein